jgi:tetratricopeptide (TPR) repeat protein
MTDKEKAKALFYEALDFIDSSDFRNAEQRLRDVLALSPGHPAALTNLALALLQQGRRDEARLRAAEAVAAAPEIPMPAPSATRWPPMTASSPWSRASRACSTIAASRCATWVA